MKALKRLCTFVIAVAIMVAPITPVHALASSTEADSAKQGVVQVNTVIVDDNSERRLVVGGAGFIVGNPEGTEYVITSRDIVNPSKELLGEACKYYGMISGDKETTINLKIATEVVVEGDVVLNASILTSSNDLDMAVLQLPQPIYTRTPLKLLTNKNYDVNDLPYAVDDSVYALGFPTMITFDSETKYYSDQQVQMSYGQIKNLTNIEGVQMVESDAVTDYYNYGGPLVNQSGYVIGMNLPSHDGEFSCALDSTKIAKILDGLGVSYSQVNSVPSIEDAATDDLANSVASTQIEKPVVTQMEKTSKGVSETVIIVISLVAVFILVCGAAAIILFFINKDRGTAKPAKVKNKSYAQSQPAVDETTVLSAAPKKEAETSVLSEDLEEAQNLGTLIRKRTLEKIAVNKSDFVLGKDAIHSDYCIERNSSISRKHAMITCGRNGAYIQDCNSTNGTFINGTKLESERAVLLNSGDVIKLSNEEFEYLA